MVYSRKLGFIFIPMQEEMTLSVPSVNMVLSVAANRGANTEILCRNVGIDPAQLTNPDGRITIRQVQDLWKEAIAATGDPNLALSIGGVLNPAAVGIVFYVMMNSPTLGRSLEKLVAYQDIICEGIRTRLEVKNHFAYLQMHIVSPAIVDPRNAVDSELSVYVHALQGLVGQKLPVQEVHFSYPRPADTSVHQQVFAPARLVFDAPVSMLVFDAMYLELPIINANPELFRMFDQFAIAYLEKLKKHSSVSIQVKQEIVQMLKGEEPGIEQVARNLAMSVRKLQLKLKEEGVTYQQLLDQVRKDIAIQHLNTNYLSTNDIAYLLGYSEPSVFFRSFKKWTGTTPGAYRMAKVA